MTQARCDARVCPARKRVDTVGSADTGSAEESCGADGRSNDPRKRADTIGSLDTGISTLAEESCSTDGDGAAAHRSMYLGPSIGVVELGSQMLPTKGSACHYEHRCRPCAFYWKESGCSQGVACEFCHLCGCDEKKRRQKKLNAIRRTEKEVKQMRRKMVDPQTGHFARFVSEPFYHVEEHQQGKFARAISDQFYYEKKQPQGDFARAISEQFYYEKELPTKAFARAISEQFPYDEEELPTKAFARAISEQFPYDEKELPKKAFVRAISEQFPYEKELPPGEFARVVSDQFHDALELPAGDFARVVSDQFHDAPSYQLPPDVPTPAACKPPPGLEAEASPDSHEVVIDYSARLRRYTM